MTATTQGRTGRPRVLDVQDVVVQAIAVVDEQGAAALTMATLARRLGVGAATLYGYVPSRARLVDLMVARLLDEQPAPPELTPARWIDALVDHLGSVRAWAVDRPALFGLMTERPRLTDQVARHVQADLDALTGVGFTPAEAITVRHALSVQLSGQVAYEMLRRQGGAASTDRGHLGDDLSTAVAHLESSDQAEVYALSVRALLVGFAGLLAPR